MDDEAQTLLLNIFQNKIDLIARSGLDSGIIKDKKFVKRIKPLVFLKEKEIMLYSILQNFETEHSECPYAIDSMRYYIRKHLNELADKFHHIKSNTIKTELALVESLRKTTHISNDSLHSCNECNEPSSSELCNVCKILNHLKELKKKRK